MIIINFPDTQLVQAFNQEHISDHLTWCINDVKMGTFYILPFDRYLFNWNLLLTT